MPKASISHKRTASSKKKPKIISDPHDDGTSNSPLNSTSKGDPPDRDKDATLDPSKKSSQSPLDQPNPSETTKLALENLESLAKSVTNQVIEEVAVRMDEMFLQQRQQNRDAMFLQQQKQDETLNAMFQQQQQQQEAFASQFKEIITKLMQKNSQASSDPATQQVSTSNYATLFDSEDEYSNLEAGVDPVRKLSSSSADRDPAQRPVQSSATISKISSVSPPPNDENQKPQQQPFSTQSSEVYVPGIERDGQASCGRPVQGSCHRVQKSDTSRLYQPKSNDRSIKQLWEEQVRKQQEAKTQKTLKFAAEVSQAQRVHNDND